MTDDLAGVRIRGLRKRYGDTIALDGLDLVARPGEILGVAGPNGAGKSTMVKVLAGEVDWDDGEILIDGAPWSSAFGSHRVAVVHQEPQLFPNLTVAQNVLAGQGVGGWQWPAVTQRQRDALEKLGIPRRLHDVPLEGLSLALQQRTEITRAIVRDARVVLFDEPNSALTPDESAELFRLMHELAASGHVVLLISHRLTELAAHSDRVAIIIDGKCVHLFERAEASAEAIAEALVRGLGTPAQSAAGDRASAAADGGLEIVGGADAKGAFADLDLVVPAGTVTALVGVEGSGAREIVRAVGGLRRFSGEVVLKGVTMSPSALAARSAFVAADRAASLFTNLSVEENLVIRLDHEISRGALGLRTRRMRAIAQELREAYHVKTAGLDIGVRSLSGGNQQKVAIAAAVGSKPDVVALEEPTRGVDVSSKAEIYAILREFAAAGGAVLLFCTEIPELYEVAERAYVVSDGRLSEPLDVGSFADLEAMAKAVSNLEQHTRRVAAAG